MLGRLMCVCMSAKRWVCAHRWEPHSIIADGKNPLFPINTTMDLPGARDLYLKAMDEIYYKLVWASIASMHLGGQLFGACMISMR